MARIVCQVLHRPHRVTFVWSEGAAFFEPYHLQDQEAELFYQAARSANQQLALLMEGAEPQASVDLARAGHQLYQSIFRHNANDRQAREIQDWLHGLRDRNELTSLDMLGDLPGRIAWNAVYDQAPAEKALRAGDPANLRPFWGRQYSIAAGKRVNPLRMASVLDGPNILLVADPALMDKLPASQKSLLGDLALAHETTVLGSIAELRDSLRDEAPDILYLFAALDGGALRIGAETLMPAELRELLAGAASGNPDPVIFLAASGVPAQWEAWELFVSDAVGALTGVVMSAVPASPALANAMGIEALSAFMKGQELGQAVLAARGHDTAALALTAFCPAHVRVAVSDNVEPALPGPEPLPLPDYPYRPLVPFESEDRALFTGREDDTVRCAGVLDDAAAHALIIHGAAGVGKSSFLRAGFIPHLETEAVGFLALRDRTPDEEFQAESTYPVVALRPGHDLLGQLAEALSAFSAQPYAYTTPTGARVSVDLPGILRAVLAGSPDTAITAMPPPDGPGNTSDAGPNSDDTVASELWRCIDRDPRALAGILDELTRRLPFELVLVIEQAEDLFTQESKGVERRRGRGLEALGKALASPARFKIVFATRADTFGRLTNLFPFAASHWQSYLLKDLSADQMLRAALWPTVGEPVPYATEIPAEKYHYAFEEGLAQRFVRDITKAARDQQCSALPLLQVYCANLYDRAVKRGATAITAADCKDAGPAGEAVVRVVDRKLKELPIDPADRKALRALMDRLHERRADGVRATALLPYRDAAHFWKGTAPLDRVVDAAAGEGLVEASQMMVEGRLDTFVSLPQEALAQTTTRWDEEKKRKAAGRATIVDMMWFVIPLVFLVAVITWKITRDASGKASSDEAPAGNQEQLVKAMQAQMERDRWPMYVGDVTRAQQAWNSDNALLTRQLLLRQQPLQQTDLRDFEWYYFWKKVQGTGMEAGHKGLITCVATTADGAIGASASLDGTVKLWNLVKGLENATLVGHAGPVLAVAFSPDGKTVASAGADKVIRLWDATVGGDKHAVVTKEQKTLTGHEGEVRALAFGQKSLVSGGADKQVITWNTETGKPAQIFKEHTQPVRALAVAPDGKTIASAGGTLLIHEGEKTLQTVKAPGTVAALAFAVDGKTLASGGAENQGSQERGAIRFWDTATGKESGTPVYHADGIFALSYLPSGKQIASAGKDNLLRIWDVAVGRQVHAYKGHIGWISSCAVAGAGDKLVSASYDGTIKTWSALPPDSVSAHQGATQALTFLPDDKAVVSGGQDGAIKFWDPATGKLLAELANLGPVTSLAYTSKQTHARLAAGAWDGKNAVRQWEVTWDAKEGLKTKELPALSGHTQGINGVAISPDGKHLASGSADGTAIVWDLSTGKQKSILKGHSGEVRCLAFPPEGPVVLTGDAGGIVRQWDIELGKEIMPPLQAHGGAVAAVSYLANEARAIGFVSAGADRAVRFWFPSDKEFGALQEHRSHGQAITSLASSSNRRFIATASLDRTVKLYDTQFSANTSRNFFGLERFTFTEMTTPIRALAVSPSSLILVAAGEDGSIRFWRAAAEAGVKKP